MSRTIQSLPEILTEESKRPLVINDTVNMLESEIQSKSGVKGALLKSTFFMIKKLRKGYLPHIMNLLIDDLALAIEPIHAEYREAPDVKTFKELLTERGDEASANLLDVMDKQIKRASPNIEGIYKKFRPDAKIYIKDALPALSQLIIKHTETTVD